MKTRGGYHCERNAVHNGTQPKPLGFRMTGVDYTRPQPDADQTQPTSGLCWSTKSVLQLHYASCHGIVDQLGKDLPSGLLQGFPVAGELSAVLSCIVGILRRQYGFLLSRECLIVYEDGTLHRRGNFMIYLRNSSSSFFFLSYSSSSKQYNISSDNFPV